MNWLYSCCTRGTTVGVDARIFSSYSELKLPAPSSWGMFEGENKCFGHGTVLLHGGEDGGARKINPLCALVGSIGATKLTPWLTRVGISFPGGFFLLWSLL